MNAMETKWLQYVTSESNHCLCVGNSYTKALIPKLLIPKLKKSLPNKFTIIL